MGFFRYLSASNLFIQPAHIYAIRDAICQYPANFGHMSLKNVTLDKQCFIKTRKGFMALAYDGDQRTLFYSENSTKSISKVQLRRGEYTQTIVKAIGIVKGTEGSATLLMSYICQTSLEFCFRSVAFRFDRLSSVLIYCNENVNTYGLCLIEGSRCFQICYTFINRCKWKYDSKQFIKLKFKNLEMLSWCKFEVWKIYDVLDIFKNNNRAKKSKNTKMQDLVKHQVFY